MKRFSFYLRSKKTAFVAAAAVAVIGLGTIGFNKVFAGPVRDCSANSIDLKQRNGGCGAANPTEFIKDVQDNKPNDLQAIYRNFGLVPSEYSKFVNTARMGMAYKSDGTIKVDGQTVATNAWSIGRTQYKGVTDKNPYMINNKKYWKAADTKIMNSDIPVMVMFDSKGVMQFAVMTACGNPVNGNKNTPHYSCDLLQKQHENGNTYSFTTKASASQGAKVVKVEYDFGDGTTATETSLSKKVTHTYKTSGDFTARVKVTVSLPGKQTVTVTSANCQTKISITPPAKPFEQCVNLTSNVTDEKKHTYKFVAHTKQGNGATLKNANFNFGDGTNANGVKPSSDTSVTANHAYTKTGTFNIKAVVNFNTNDGVKNDTCQTSVTIGQPPKPPKPPKPPQHFQQCVGLNALITDDAQRAVKFTATTSQGNGSVLKSADFNFGDGATANGVKPASSSTVVANHAFASTGDYTVTAIVHFSFPGGSTSANCQTHVQFTEQHAPVCDGVELTKLGGREVSVLVRYNADGAHLQSVIYDFGDGGKPLFSSSNAATHTYAKDGDYSITASLTFVGGAQPVTVSGENCSATVSFAAPTCTAPNGETFPEGSAQCHPTCTAPNGTTHPEGSPECQPTCTDVNGQTHPAGSTECETCTAPNGQMYQKGDEHCQPQPTELVNTGPGGIVGLFVGTSAVGAVAYRWFVGRKLFRG